jgi:cobaltochelatase CobN
VHLLAAQPGGFTDDAGIIDLQQSPADIVILSAADSSLAALADTADALPADYPSLRLANWLQLLKPAAFDLYQTSVLEKAKVVVVSFLGGASYWAYGFEQLQAWAAADSQRVLIVVPGDSSIDEQLFAASSVPQAESLRVWQLLRQGGQINNEQLFYFIAKHYLNCQQYQWHEAQLLPNCMMYIPPSANKYRQASFADWQRRWGTGPHDKVCLLLFYRSHLQSANTAMFDELIELLESHGLQPLPIAISSLKDAQSLALVNALSVQAAAKLIINTTGFASNAVTTPNVSSQPNQFNSPFTLAVPVLQLVLSSSTEQDWESYQQGLRSRDIAMQVVLPEMDGRIITRAVSFKSEAYYSQRCEITVVRYQLHKERANFVASLAQRYCQLALKPNQNKRIALILANYPTKDGRIGNGVGLDTPASTINILQALAQSGYPVAAIPADGTSLIQNLLGSITNNPNTLHQLPCWQSISIEDYQHYFSSLPNLSQQAILARWGEPQADPKYRQGRLMIAGMRLGETFVGIQPARGFNIDLLANYHDPDLVPPHSYLAFYFWLRHCYSVDALVHVGKHGNVEWLPGKGTALSQHCWSDIAMGPMPHFYPFIVNDPGEGAQAKRRTQAVSIDHLMPPMTRAEVYGDLAELEVLVDEYYQALGMDQRREQWLREQILTQVKSTNVLEELPGHTDTDDGVLAGLDTYLCDIKEAQIRHGLHVLGALPNNEKLSDTLVALLRLPRGGAIVDEGLLHNLIADMQLIDTDQLFDPFIDQVQVWDGNRPQQLVAISDQLWRTNADTRERLELLAIQLMMDYVVNDGAIDGILATALPRTCQQLDYAKAVILDALEVSVVQEIKALLAGLSGQFVEPGPSGAPTRGRLDTLPTGRNFYSLDNRSVPSPAAWALGQQSAQSLIERHLQEHGDYPKQVGLSVWGTATMRTGGDDIAQAFALMGLKPVWALGSQRVIDFEIIPAMLLQRPRIDVTLRVSGFFRDAFPNVMKLFDAAVLAIANFDEPAGMNVIQHNIQQRSDELIKQGLSVDQAHRQASYRVFGSKPGAYGAGLQGLIDERCWETRDDLAQAYLNWGGYAYGSQKDDSDGVVAKQSFQHRLSQLEVVVHNQDNREHDLLDSDDYYQFQGGMTNAITTFAGSEPVVYHNDHSNPSQPKVRTLKEELTRVIRSRVLNPKWINAMQEHGYKGAFEIAASIDYLFAYDATTNLIDDYQYESVADSLVFEENVQQFMQQNNPKALEEMTERLLEATQRGLWQEPGDYASKLQNLLLEIDAQQEGSS